MVWLDTILVRQSNISNFSYFYKIACLPDLCLSLISTFPNHWFILSVNSINHLTFPPSIFMHNFLDNILSGLYVHSVISNEVVYFVMNLFATCMMLPPPLSLVVIVSFARKSIGILVQICFLESTSKKNYLLVLQLL